MDMKIGVSSYSFAAYRKATGANYIDICNKAKEIGFEGIEFIDLICDENDSFENRMALAKEIKAHCDRIGLDIPAYTVGANLIGEGGESTVEKLFEALEIANVLGAGVLRHDICYKTPDGMGYKDVIAEATPRIRRVADRAAELGIISSVENHGRLIQAPEIVEELILAVDRPNYRWLCDVGNFLCADCEPLASCKIAAKYTVHVHAKDFLYRSGADSGKAGFGIGTLGGNFIRGTVVGHGVVPVEDCLRALKDGGYDGYVSLEFEGPENPEYALTSGYNNLKEFIDNISK